jgi:hypothetical protein
VLRVSPSEVEESMALLGKAHLFNKAADTGVFSDMIFGLFYEDGCGLRADKRSQKKGSSSVSRTFFIELLSTLQMAILAVPFGPRNRICILKEQFDSCA